MPVDTRPAPFRVELGRRRPSGSPALVQLSLRLDKDGELTLQIGLGRAPELHQETIAGRTTLDKSSSTSHVLPDARVGVKYSALWDVPCVRGWAWG